MRTVRYALGGVHAARIITAADFKSVEVNDQGKITLDESNGFTAEVSNKAAEYLLAKETNFVEVRAGTEEPVAGTVETQVTIPEASTPVESGPEPIVASRRIKDAPQA